MNIRVEIHCTDDCNEHHIGTIQIVDTGKSRTRGEHLYSFHLESSIGCEIMSGTFVAADDYQVAFELARKALAMIPWNPGNET